jgi:hypothetical protein
VVSGGATVWIYAPSTDTGDALALLYLGTLQTPGA